MSTEKIVGAAAAVSLAINLLGGASLAFGAGRRVLELPARVDKIEKLEVDVKILKTQMDWVVKLMSKKFGVEPPDLSEFQEGGHRAPR